MQINLSELMNSEGKKIQLKAMYEADVFRVKTGGEYPVIEKKPFVLSLTNLGKKKILMETELDVSLSMPCDRCLEEVRQNIHISVSKELDMEETEEQRIKALDETNFISGSNLDVDEFVYSEILVSLPMKVLCNENCKGICNRCGTNLNHGTCNCDSTELDPRMAKIRDIFKNS